jgi:hypothetical protein
MHEGTPMLQKAIAKGHTGPMSQSSWIDAAVKHRSKQKRRAIHAQLQAAVAQGKMYAVPAHGQHGPTIHYGVIER